MNGKKNEIIILAIGVIVGTILNATDTSVFSVTFWATVATVSPLSGYLYGILENNKNKNRYD